MMINLFVYKKTILISIGIVAIAISFCIGLTAYTNSRQNPNMSKIEYRTDVEPLTKRFGEMLDIQSCFWKTGTIGKANFGPSSYWMKGYAFISQENADNLKSQYNLTEVDISFDDGVTPDVTGKAEFNWCYNNELSRRIAGLEFVGEFYFDVKNNIFYFDLESN